MQILHRAMALPGGRIPNVAMAALCAALLQLAAAPAAAQSVPETIIPIGDGPYAMDVTANGRSAFVSLLFPKSDIDPNLFVVNLVTPGITNAAHFGNRLFRVGAINPELLSNGSSAALPVALIQGDVDRLTIVDAITEEEYCVEKTGQNPSNVHIVQSNGPLIIGDTRNLAIVAAAGGQLTLHDMDRDCEVIGEVDVGGEPRDITMAPGGRYLWVVLRQGARIVTIDLELVVQSSTVRSGTVLSAAGSDPDRRPPKTLASPFEVSSITVGQDPSTIEISPDGQRAIVGNLTNNTVSILDISSPDARILRDTRTNSLQIPVGIQPTSIAVTPDGTRAFVANAGSNWVTVVDMVNPGVLGVLTIQQPGEAIASAAAAVRVTPDGQKLLVAESGNGANLLIYNIADLELEPLPPVEVPDEPATVSVLERREDESCGFYTAGLTLQDGAREGTWGLEVLTTAGNRLLEGGINLGGAFEEDALNPGFGAFNIANRGNENQIVSIKINASALPTPGYSAANLGISVQLFNSAREPVTEEVLGTDFIDLEVELEPGFYIVRIKSQPGSPRGTFLMELLTRFVDRPGGGFQGGANVGGFITRRDDGTSTTAFAGFCISQTQDIRMRTEAGTTRGERGAGNLILTLRDRQRDVIQVVSNSTPPPPPVEPPPPPSLDGITPDLYVDANAAPGGNGSSSRPFRSITEAVGKNADPGDVILVRPGTYSPSLTGETLPIGSPGPGLNRIPPGVLLIGSGAADTIIDAEDTLRDGSPVNAFGVGSDDVRITGFTVRGSSAVGIFILGADNVEIDHNYFIGNGRFAVGASGVSGFVLRDNVAQANNETGFSVADATRVSVSDPPAGCPPAFGACIIRNIANEHARDGFLMTTGGDYYVASNAAFNNGISGIEVNNRNNLRPLTSVVKDNLTSNNGGVLFPFSGTGILITEFAHATELSGNQADNNRPGGIAVFEDSTADRVENNVIRNSKQNALIIQKRSAVDTVSGNQVINSGLAGIFVDNESMVGTISNNSITGNGTCDACTAAKGGLAILGSSSVELVENSSFDANSLGMQIANASGAGVIRGSTFGGNRNGGILVRDRSSVPNFSGNKVLGNGGQTSIAFDDSTGLIRDTEISSTEGAGVSIYQGAVLTIENATVKDSPLEGLAVFEGSTLTLRSVEVLSNGESGVLTTGNGTSASVEDSQVRDNGGYGLNAQNGSSIRCSGSTVVSGNGEGPTLGNVEGCD